MIKKINIIIALLLICSCKLVPGVTSSEAEKKLSYALQMGVNGRCVPAFKLAQDGLNIAKKKDDKINMQYAYVVLSINSEVACKFLYKKEISEEELKAMPRKYFEEAMKIEISKKDAEDMIKTASDNLKDKTDLPALEKYNQYKIMQFYHIILAGRYSSEDSRLKVAEMQKLIDDLKSHYGYIAGREYIFDYQN